jgi:signal transduction histidine kinase/ActR/RegA family two-component response regulator
MRWRYHNPVTNKDYIIYNRLIRWPDGRNVRFELDVDITELNRGRQALLRTEKLESLSVLAGGIAHDFNNLLTGVLGNISLARETANRRELEKLLEETARAANQARELTGQLLTFAKGSPSRPREVADLRAIVVEAATFALRGSKVGCRVAPFAATFAVEADPGQIHQAVQNLVLNAAQSMDRGGRIDINFKGTTFEDGAHPALSGGEYVALEVSDRGTGIPQHLTERVFDPFFTTKEGGTGLGLSTAYSIAVQHGGTLELQPRRGGGTNARMYLPLVEEAVPSKPNETRTTRGAGARILLMDDEQIVRKTAVSMLKALGYDPAEAADGEQAIGMFVQAAEAGRPFAAIVLDLTVSGGLGGVDTLDRILEIDPKAKAVASSGYSLEAVDERTQPHGFSAFLPKPYSLDELGRVLGELLADQTPPDEKR